MQEIDIEKLELKLVGDRPWIDVPFITRAYYDDENKRIIVKLSALSMKVLEETSGAALLPKYKSDNSNVEILY